MYFKSREEAGQKLAAKLLKYKESNCAIIALTAGGVLIGEQIAELIHANLMLLLTEPITLPGETEPIAALSDGNTFTYNSMYSVGEIEEFNLEYYSYIDQERIGKLHDLHLLEGQSGEMQKRALKNHTIILVSDGFNNGFSLEVSNDFLKPISIGKLVIVTPFSSPEAFDKMHLLADEVVCLNIVDSFLGVNHYYDSNTIPPIPELLKRASEVSLHWKP